MNDQQTLQQRLFQVNNEINRIAQKHQRNPDDVMLLAVSKTKPAEDVRKMAEIGQKAFGENYVQEAVEKIEQLSDLGLEWHFIGPIQSNKTQIIANHFDWVHSVDRLKIAKRLSAQRPPSLPPLNICIQVNISMEQTKSGCSPDELPLLIKEISSLPNLTLRGLMAIPESSDTFEQQRLPFRKMAQLLDQANQTGEKLDTLSMGMSNDLEAAVAEGATIVRVGTALFGARTPKIN